MAMGLAARRSEIMAEKEIQKLRVDDLNIIQDRLARERKLREGGLTTRVTVHMGSY